MAKRLEEAASRILMFPEEAAADAETAEERLEMRKRAAEAKKAVGLKEAAAILFPEAIATAQHAQLKLQEALTVAAQAESLEAAATAAAEATAKRRQEAEAARRRQEEAVAAVAMLLQELDREEEEAEEQRTAAWAATRSTST